jgi:hypothetical protein
VPTRLQHPDTISARLAAARVIDDFEGDALALPKQVRVGNVASMHENICAALVRSDETEAAFFLPSGANA